MGIGAFVLDLLYPPRCVFCRGFLKRQSLLICPACAKILPRTAQGGVQRGEDFGLCYAPLYYEGAVRESLHRYKFGGASHYAGTYGALLGACLRENADGDWDLITWAPVSRKRLRERGYDQARLLAEQTAAFFSAEAVPALEKIRNTPKQSTLGSRAARRANVAGAYRVPDPARVAGKRVLLVDDIVTTSATLSECARALKHAGAAGVVCAALARARE